MTSLPLSVAIAMHLNHLGGSAQQIGGHARIGRQVIISNITVIHRLK